MAEAIHIGRKISKIRELRGMKQETLATELGISQQAVSKIEQSAEVEDSALEKIAGVLGVSIEAIKNFSDEAALNYFNTFNDNSTGAFNNFNCTFNPIEKVIELYERLLASEREKIELLKGNK
ncbi:helix-turn-helix transcriptional regulator [Mucilaginibacter sp. ZT4R22]|uniref:Helix-turn-helix transcriptional regulator n=1 Tax=Mucilaginibacter pankratovii TaxID=2772110 RepID=A0ABR7WSW9_9SPHI|nr:helix-turn-helix transcriptional regulator [Mucilaginibacter pankratovii]MBD1365365.1 helix-turn-helix transcriptional regulator [Mucilaginibacter pankratovii]